LNFFSIAVVVLFFFPSFKPEHFLRARLSTATSIPSPEPASPARLARPRWISSGTLLLTFRPPVLVRPLVRESMPGRSAPRNCLLAGSLAQWPPPPVMMGQVASALASFYPLRRAVGIRWARPPASASSTNTLRSLVRTASAAMAISARAPTAPVFFWRHRLACRF